MFYVERIISLLVIIYWWKSILHKMPKSKTKYIESKMLEYVCIVVVVVILSFPQMTSRSNKTHLNKFIYNKYVCCQHKPFSLPSHENVVACAHKCFTHTAVHSNCPPFNSRSFPFFSIFNENEFAPSLEFVRVRAQPKKKQTNSNRLRKWSRIHPKRAM